MPDRNTHKTFSYKTREELDSAIKELNIRIDSDHDLSPLKKELKIENLTIPNRMLIQPMEGYDSSESGSPTALSFRRYKRYAAGGAGIIWFEATTVRRDGRSNPGQLWINDKNADTYKKLVAEVKETGLKTNGYEPVCVLQTTHSGRYSKPDGTPAPVIAHHSEVLDKQFGLDPDYPLISDDDLKSLQDLWIKAAIEAEECGFDGIDFKACHRYLIAELHASFTRKNSIYGGEDFENRTRFLRELASRGASELKRAFITTRLNAYDAIRHPYGFGVNKKDHKKPDLTETKKLIGILKEEGMPLINLSIGNPYWEPHYGRPYDFPIAGFNPPAEHPLVGIERFVNIVGELQQEYPDLPMVSTGYTWLRQYGPEFAAATIKSGKASIAGFGRQAFAYPDFASDIIKKNSLDPMKTCVACSCCTQIMRDSGQTGCVMKDSEIYGENYRKYRKMARDRIIAESDRCRDCAAPTCREACPAGIDIPAFIKKMAKGETDAAYEVLTRHNGIPEICSMVCPVEVLCEGACVENITSANPIPIHDIQKYICAETRRKGSTGLKTGPDNGKKAVVIGAGPAGAAAAKRLLEKGFHVTIIEKESKPGGFVRQVIPSKRIEAAAAAGEIESILKAADPSRLEWRTEKAVSRSYSLDDILNEGFDSVFVAAGLQDSTPLPGARKPENGVIGALDFLTEMKVSPRKMPSSVAVIGGGNSAMDAAMAAKDNGADDVYILYRRSFSELPAWPEERNHVLNAGVHFMVLTQPVEYISENGNLKGIKAVRTRLGKPEKDGRRRPEAIPGSEYIIEAELAVEAVGQRIPESLAEGLTGIEITKWGTVAVAGEGSCRTVRDKVYAGGDIVNGGQTAVKAAAEGYAAAEEICRDLKV
ncbi:MAG: FAD-dependent oxidoreductase [Fibrobacterota bacterium]